MRMVTISLSGPTDAPRITAQGTFLRRTPEGRVVIKAQGSGETLTGWPLPASDERSEYDRRLAIIAAAPSDFL